VVTVVLAFVAAGWTFAFFRRRAATSTSPWRRGGRSTHEVSLPVELDEAERLARELLRTFGNERKPATAADGPVIEVVTAADLKTSGTVLRVVLRDAPTGTLATITGWPGAQLFDWGHSRRTVQEVAARLHDLSNARAA